MAQTIFQVATGEVAVGQRKVCRTGSSENIHMDHDLCTFDMTRLQLHSISSFQVLSCPFPSKSFESPRVAVLRVLLKLLAVLRLSLQSNEVIRLLVDSQGGLPHQMNYLLPKPGPFFPGFFATFETSTITQQPNQTWELKYIQIHQKSHESWNYACHLKVTQRIPISCPL